MLKKCQKIWGGRANLNLVSYAAEDLPFIDQSFDVVLHVGGINFFSDKKRAIEEMIRVAKPGTKIMIADETSDYIDSRYKKNVLTRKAYKNATFDLSEIEALIPEDMEDTTPACSGMISSIASRSGFRKTKKDQNYDHNLING